jgi:hypothetical protein
MACVFVREHWRETTVVDELFVAVLTCCTSVDRGFRSAWASVVGGKKGVRVLRSCDSDAFSWLLASVLVLLHFLGSGF